MCDQTSSTDSWNEYRLTDLFEIDSGKAAGAFSSEKGSYSLAGANGEIGQSSKANFGPGYIVGRVGAVGEVSKITGRVWASDNTLTLVPEKDCDFRFAYHLLKHAKLYRLATVTAQPLLTQTGIGALSVRIPPVKQQAAIARILDTIDAAILETDATIEKLNAIKQGLLNDLLTRGVDETGRLRPPREEVPELYKESKLGWIPKAWDVGRIEDFGSICLGRQRSPAQAKGLSMFPYLRVANVYDGFIDYSDVLQMNFTNSERNTFSLMPGDILLNEGQSLELVGRCAIYDGPKDAYCFQNTLVRFRSDQVCLSLYARMLFKHWLDSGNFMQIAKQTTSIAHLGADRFAKMWMPLPSVEEQEGIIECFRKIGTKQQAETTTLRKFEMIKSALMDDLLTGRVRVTSLLAAHPELGQATDGDEAVSRANGS